MGMHEGGAVDKGGLHVEHRGQGHVLDVDRFERVMRRVRVARGDDGDASPAWFT